MFSQLEVCRVSWIFRNKLALRVLVNGWRTSVELDIIWGRTESSGWLQMLMVWVCCEGMWQKRRCTKVVLSSWNVTVASRAGRRVFQRAVLVAVCSALDQHSFNVILAQLSTSPWLSAQTMTDWQLCDITDSCQHQQLWRHGCRHKLWLIDSCVTSLTAVNISSCDVMAVGTNYDWLTAVWHHWQLLTACTECCTMSAPWWQSTLQSLHAATELAVSYTCSLCGDTSDTCLIHLQH